MSLEECLVRMYSAKFITHKAHPHVGTTTYIYITISGDGTYDITYEAFEYLKTTSTRFATPIDIHFPPNFLSTKRKFPKPEQDKPKADAQQPLDERQRPL